MNNYYANSAKTKNPKLTYTQICTYKKTSRFQGRIEEPLKNIIDKACLECGKDFSEATRLLWLHFLDKRGYIEGFKKKELIHGIDWELE